MKNMKSFGIVVLVGFLSAALGLVVGPQSGFAQDSYSIRQAGPPEKSASKEIIIKTSKVGTVDSLQQKQGLLLKVKELIQKVKGELKLAMRHMTEVGMEKSKIRLEPANQRLIKPKLELQVKSVTEQLEKTQRLVKKVEGQPIKPKFVLKKMPMQPQMKTAEKLELKVKSLVPVEKENIASRNEQKKMLLPNKKNDIQGQKR